MKLLTVDLERELHKSKRAEITRQQELTLQEANKILKASTDGDLEILYQLGLDNNIKQSKKLNRDNSMLIEMRQKFGADKVFSEHEIKATCMKYRLRFLRSSMFEGAIDPLIPGKVREFNIKLQSYIKYPHSDYKIMAPALSFKLEERPKDPLLFGYIDSIGDTKYYALIHKWGNDLSITRRVLGFFTAKRRRIAFTQLLIAILLIWAAAKYTMVPHADGYNVTSVWTVLMFIVAVLIAIISLPWESNDILDRPWYGNSSNDIWNSIYK